MKGLAARPVSGGGSSHNIGILLQAVEEDRLRRIDPDSLESGPITLAWPAGLNGVERWALVGLLGLALALRLPGHLTTGLWYDEIRTLLESVRLPLASLLTTFASDNTHPLYSVFARLSVLALGENALALRLPALVFGVLSVGTLYLYALRVTSRWEATAASLLLATSFHHVWFSQNARAYTLLLLLTLIATLQFEDLLAGRDGRRIGSYGVSLGLGIYAHASAVFLALAHLVAHLGQVGTERRRPTLAALFRAPALRGLCLGGLVALLLYAPMLRQIVGFFLAPSGGGSLAPDWSSQWAMAQAAARSVGLGLGAGTLVAAGAGVVLTCGAVSYWRQCPFRLVLFLGPGALFATAVLLLGRPFRPRFLFFLAGFLSLLLVRGLAVLGRPLLEALEGRWGTRVARTIAACALAAAMIAWLVPLPRAYLLPKQDFEGALAWVEEHRSPEVPVLTAGITSIVYRDYFRTDFTPVETLEELEESLVGGHGGYVLVTLRETFRRRSPELLAEIRTRGVRVARFRGSVVGGDIEIYRIARANRSLIPSAFSGDGRDSASRSEVFRWPSWS